MPMSAASKAASPRALRRMAPLIVLVAVLALVMGMGWHRYLSLETVGLNYEALQRFIAGNLAAALCLFILAYVALVALSLPGAVILSLTGGLLFGWKIGTVAIVVGATTGATILFLVARSSFGETLTARAGPWLTRLRDGFRANAFNYLLFLRLVPVFPFFVVNLAAAALGMPVGSYIVATFVGIIPATIAYALAGASLGSVIEAQNQAHNACLAKRSANPDVACPYTIDTTALVTRELLIAFVLLGLIALAPVIVKKWRARNATA